MDTGRRANARRACGVSIIASPRFDTETIAATPTSVNDHDMAFQDESVNIASPVAKCFREERAETASSPLAGLTGQVEKEARTKLRHSVNFLMHRSSSSDEQPRSRRSGDFNDMPAQQLDSHAESDNGPPRSPRAGLKAAGDATAAAAAATAAALLAQRIDRRSDDGDGALRSPCAGPMAETNKDATVELHSGDRGAQPSTWSAGDAGHDDSSGDLKDTLTQRIARRADADEAPLYRPLTGNVCVADDGGIVDDAGELWPRSTWDGTEPKDSGERVVFERSTFNGDSAEPEPKHSPLTRITRTLESPTSSVETLTISLERPTWLIRSREGRPDRPDDNPPAIRSLAAVLKEQDEDGILRSPRRRVAEHAAVAERDSAAGGSASATSSTTWTPPSAPGLDNRCVRVRRGGGRARRTSGSELAVVRCV